MTARRTGPCDHCGRVTRLRRALYADQRYCERCWERFGGRHKVANHNAARRRARGH